MLFNSNQLDFHEHIYFLNFFQNNVKNFQIPKEVVERLINDSASQNNILILVKFMEIIWSLAGIAHRRVDYNAFPFQAFLFQS